MFPKMQLRFSIVHQQFEGVDEKTIYKNIVKCQNMLKDGDLPASLRKELVDTIRQKRALRKMKIKHKSYLRAYYKGVDVMFPLRKNLHLPAKELRSVRMKIMSLLQQKRKRNEQLKATIRTVYGHNMICVGGVHENGQDYLNLGQRIGYRRMSAYQSPRSMKKHLGVEIEFYCPRMSRETINELFIKKGLSTYVRIMTDTTIHPTASDDRPYSGWEACILVEEDKLQPVVEKVVKVLVQDVGARVNDSCGLHVHLDCRQRDAKIVYENLVNCQDIFFAMTTKKRQSNRYCKKQTFNWDDINSLSHYAAISRNAYSKHSTLEVRTHYGTLDTDTIVNWCKLLVCIADYDKVMENVSEKTLASIDANMNYVKKALKAQKEKNAKPKKYKAA